MYSFKDFVVTNIHDDEYIEYRAQKRHRGVIGEASEVSDIEEAIDTRARIKKSQSMRRLSKVLARKRKLALKKTANKETRMKRATRRARTAMFKKMAGGKNKSQMSMSDRQAIEKRMAKRKNVIDRMARKLLPDVKKDEMARHTMVGDAK